MPLANPSRTFQTVCAYWLTSSEGSRANAQAQDASRNASEVTVSVRDLPIRTYILVQTLQVVLVPNCKGVICITFRSLQRCIMFFQKSSGAP